MRRSNRSYAPVVTEAVARQKLPTVKRKEILVPIDFSKASVNALRHARELAEEEQARLTLVNVIEEPRSFRTLDVISQRRARYEEQAVRLQELADRELGKHPRARIEIREGTPSVEIARVASKHQVDIIVLGRHEHQRLWPWCRGHTASKLSKKAPCAVLLLPVAHLN
jgi:nucleotide-binding universal stress UspA family protein